MILVTGATGGVGGALVSRLSTAGTAARALVRTDPRADDLRGYDVEVVVGDYADRESLRAAVAGVDAVFLADRVSGSLAAEERALVEVLAQERPQARVVVLASAGVDADPVPDVRLLAAHREVVDALRASGLPTTVLAPAPALQDLLGCAAAVQERAALPCPTGEAPVAWVDARDVAAVAQHVLGSDGHDGAVYTVTGPEALGATALAAALSEVVGHEVGVEVPEVEAQRAALVARGLDDWTVEATLEHDAWLRDGGAAQVTGEVEKATGSAARGAREFFAEHRAVFGRR